MRYKILTVDDSKTVRTIVRKAFRNYDCEVYEASNGVEGLAALAKDTPDVILLDVTMPVMDGVAMLTRLKTDPVYRGIPVIMLTAEGGRDNVLRIAKIGVRDYMVKPFREELLVAKVSRIVDLKALSEQPAKLRSIFDPATILVVEDKPAIVQQIQEGLRQTPWEITGVKNAIEAAEVCGRSQPDLIVVSLSLPDDAAFGFYDQLRKDSKFAHTPVFGLVVKTELQAQQQAQQLGFAAVITKPLDIPELEAKIAKAMNLDTSQRYFTVENDVFLIRLPENCNPLVVNEIQSYLKPKTSDAVDGGIAKAIIDVHDTKRLDMIVFRLLSQTMHTCREHGLQFALVGNPHLSAECRGFEDTKNWNFLDSIEEAKASLNKGTGQTQPIGA